MFALAVVAPGLGCERDRPGVPASNAPDRPRGTLYVRHVWSPSISRIDLASGQTVTASFDELAPGDPLYSLARVGGQLVVYGAGSTYAIDPGLKARRGIWASPWYFVPSAREGRVWLMTLDPESPGRRSGILPPSGKSLSGRPREHQGRRATSEHGASILAAVSEACSRTAVASECGIRRPAR